MEDVDIEILVLSDEETNEGMSVGYSMGGMKIKAGNRNEATNNGWNFR